MLDLLIPISGRDSPVTIRNHTIAVGKKAQHPKAIRQWCSTKAKPTAELGIDVGYVRLTRSNRKGAHGKEEGVKGKSPIGVVVAALGPPGKQPRVWASAWPGARTIGQPPHANFSSIVPI